MSSHMLNPASSSSLSNDSQIRYQKAVREISKLIGMNNTMKRDADNYRTMCQNLQIQNRQLYENFQQINNEKRGFDERIRNYEVRIKELENIIQMHKKKQQALISASMLDKQRSKHQEQISILNDKLNEQGNTIINLQQNVGQLQKDNKDLKSTNEKLNEQLKKLQEEGKEKVSITQCIRCPELKARLEQSNQYRMVLQREIIEVKKGQYPVIQPIVSNNRGRDQRDMMITSLEERVRMREEQERRKNIEVYRLKEKIEKLEQELRRYRDKQRLMETTAIQADSQK